MPISKRTQTLYAALAKTLGVGAVPADDNGRVQLTIDDSSTVTLFAEDEFTLLMVSPVLTLPKNLDYVTVLWLLRRNFYDSPIAPFRVSCDTAGSIVIWGRMPVEGMTGEGLAKLIDALAAEADLIREELAVD